MHGAQIVVKVLGDPKNFQEWQGELDKMSSRIKKMREALVAELNALGTPSTSGDWNHITSQIGMFAYTGLNRMLLFIIVSSF
jgi:aspartate/tyrosine/aromatic aminotransferase